MVTTSEYNTNDNFFDLIAKMNAPFNESMFYDADGKRRFGEVAWYSAYEKDRSLPAQNNYETYLDMPFLYNQHIVHQLNDWNPETSSGATRVRAIRTVTSSSAAKRPATRDRTSATPVAAPASAVTTKVPTGVRRA